MHSSLNRLQTSFGFFTTCAFTVASIIALISIIPSTSPAAFPAATIKATDIQVAKGRPHYYSNKREEYASIRFDLDADLTPLFTWNTKQLFVYVTANYPSSSTNTNSKAATSQMSESVIWDMIIPATATPCSVQNLKTLYFPDKKTLRLQKQQEAAKAKAKRTGAKTTTTDIVEPGRIRLRNQKPKYQITDPTGIMAGRSNVTLQVSWNVQPWVGALVWDKGLLGPRWKDGKIGRSKSFDLPLLKGSSGKSETVKDSDGPKTPKGGEATPIIEI